MSDFPQLSEANAALAAVLSGHAGAETLLAAAHALVPATAGFIVANPPDAAPVWLADSYAGAEAKAAVQRYIGGTYLVNPIWNAIRDGLQPGIYRMADLAPDNWDIWHANASVLLADDEEIGFRTPGWPEGLAEISLLTGLPGGATGEISLARPVAEGGFPDGMETVLRAFLPLFDLALAALWARQGNPGRTGHLRRLEDFGRDRLSPREAEILRMVLKGHSNLSISLTLGITIPTVKTHRQKGYAKLGIATQQELFHSFLLWAEAAD
ncbi:response regulator transcription factor [Paenirhodobacter sp.]|uniref:response regulator transcription factor n=1 Tax=Paenirhodobacter sp. TaxID=1965326 RepID=UPI003B3C634F